MRDLCAVDGVRKGSASRFHEMLHPHPAPVGGHQNPGVVTDAAGDLDARGSFRFHLTWIDDEVRSIDIALG